MREMSDKKHLYVFSVLSAALYSACIIAGFAAFGKPMLQIFISVFLSAAVTVVLIRFSKSEVAAANGIMLCISSFLVYATLFQIYLQMKLLASGGSAFSEWQYMFYFDKPMCMGAVWFGAAAVLCINSFFIMKRELSERALKSLKIGFYALYIALLVYSFILMRPIGSKTDAFINLVPFSTINAYISQYSDIPYEVFMMVGGNLFYFSPLGFCLFFAAEKRKGFIPKLILLILTPVLLISAIELSQYYLKNGFCEIDDFSMNLLGFWLGAAAAKLFDKIKVALLNRK